MTEKRFWENLLRPIFEFLLVVTVMWLQRCWNFVTIHLLVRFHSKPISFRIWADLSALWLTMVVLINIGHSGHGWQSPKYLQSYKHQLSHFEVLVLLEIYALSCGSLLEMYRLMADQSWHNASVLSNVGTGHPLSEFTTLIIELGLQQYADHDTTWCSRCQL